MLSKLQDIGTKFAFGVHWGGRSEYLENLTVHKAGNSFKRGFVVARKCWEKSPFSPSACLRDFLVSNALGFSKKKKNPFGISELFRTFTEYWEFSKLRPPVLRYEFFHESEGRIKRMVSRFPISMSFKFNTARNPLWWCFPVDCANMQKI